MSTPYWEIVLKFIDVIIGAIASWPVAFFIIVLLFRATIIEFLSNLKSFKWCQYELSLQKQTPPATMDKGDTSNNNIPPTEEEYKKNIFFERVFGMIFGTQIEALRVLNTAGNSGVPLDVLNTFYAKYKMLAPASTYSRDQYFKFLANFELISNENDIYKITDMGKEFLEYINKNLRDFIKAF
jgi:hypothetical protein